MRKAKMNPKPEVVKLEVKITFEVSAVLDGNNINEICRNTVIDFTDIDHLYNVLMDAVYDVEVRERLRFK